MFKIIKKFEDVAFILVDAETHVMYWMLYGDTKMLYNADGAPRIYEGTLTEDMPEIEVQPIHCGNGIKIIGTLHLEQHGYYACSKWTINKFYSISRMRKREKK